MDDAIPSVRFDEAGQCSCCRDAIGRRVHEWWPNDIGERKLDELAATLRREGRGRKYDAMVGLSGGIDSAYLAHMLRERYELRLLAVHVDGGWNSEPAVNNIETLVRKLDLDLYTYVVEWNEMRDLQSAFLKASVVNQDIPQDHAFFGTLYRTAARFGIRYFLSGVNYATENIQPTNFGHPYMDVRHIRAIHREFGSVPLATFPFMDLTEFIWRSRIRRSLVVHKPLNYIAYSKDVALAVLTGSYQWRDYGAKHHESRFTKFHQQIYLPRKYGFDKRRLHLSSLIVSGQMTRDDALAELALPIISEKQARFDVKFVAKKLGCSVAELDACIGRAPRHHLEYPNNFWVHSSLTGVRKLVRGALRPFVRGVGRSR
jgi:N-acetyl sugar amidotransferase